MLSRSSTSLLGSRSSINSSRSVQDQTSGEADLGRLSLDAVRSARLLFRKTVLASERKVFLTPLYSGMEILVTERLLLGVHPRDEDASPLFGGYSATIYLQLP
jgi:hypothetical protein